MALEGSLQKLCRIENNVASLGSRVSWLERFSVLELMPSKELFDRYWEWFKGCTNVLAEWMNVVGNLAPEMVVTSSV
jgi:hypothetical protein